MGSTALKASQLAALSSMLAKNFTQFNPGQDAFNDSLLDSAKGMVAAEAAKEAAKKAKSKKGIKGALTGALKGAGVGFLTGGPAGAVAGGATGAIQGYGDPQLSQLANVTSMASPGIFKGGGDTSVKSGLSPSDVLPQTPAANPTPGAPQPGMAPGLMANLPQGVQVGMQGLTGGTPAVAQEKPGFWQNARSQFATMNGGGTQAAQPRVFTMGGRTFVEVP